MNLAISDELRKLIERRVESGRYASPEAVVTAALHALDRDEGFGDFAAGELDRLLAEGEKSGRPLDGAQVFGELRTRRQGNLG